MIECQLPFRNTCCEGPILPFEIVKKREVHACLKHSKLFQALGELYESGITTKALKDMSIEDILKKYRELKDGEKILADQTIQEASETLV